MHDSVFIHCVCLFQSKIMLYIYVMQILIVQQGTIHRGNVIGQEWLLVILLLGIQGMLYILPNGNVA